MKIKKETIVLSLMLTFVFCIGYSMVYAGSGIPGAPWFPNESATGRHEYSGTLYVDFVDSGRNRVPGGVGNQFGEGYREEVVYINFLLVLYPSNPSGETMFFSGIGKTCEYIDEDWPECPVGTDVYNDLFYIPGDYVLRIGVAAHNFFKETVYPALCGNENCGELKSAPILSGSGNADEVVSLLVIPQPSPPWYWVQPVTIVTQ